MAEAYSNALSKSQYTPLSYIENEGSLTAAVSLDTSAFESVLGYVSDSDFKENVWLVSFPEYHMRKEIKFEAFSKLNIKYITLVKCWCIDMLGLSYRLSVIKQKLSKAAVFLNYLQQRNIRLTGVRNSLLEIFLNRYKDNPLIYNNISAAVSDLLEFSMQNGAVFTEKLSCPVLVQTPSNAIVRAPDKCVMESLDRIFFTDNKLPSDMRCLYLLMRLILNRISEVLSISLDCISYPREGIYTICIPTKKETPFHRPISSKYHRSIDDYYTARLYEAIQTQKAYASSCQSSLPEEFKNYLFVSCSQEKKLVTTSDFNDFLAKLCTERKILDAEGNIARITSHQLRHAGITDRLQSLIISPEQTMKEANHSSISTTMGYGYASAHDEAERNKEIVQNVFKTSYTNDAAKAQTVSAKKYKALQENPFVRAVPGLGLCTNMRCKPRFEECINCPHFTPDANYREYFLECAEMCRERLQKLSENPKRNEAAISFNHERLSIYEKYLERIEQI